MKPEILDLTDQTDRTLIKEELEANIFVEAGAGTGKTHELVKRICAMVDADVELKSVAAITFTEKAAGELRERVRLQLEGGSRTERRVEALNQLDTAPIGTIHSFAARIISEHPIEAGVPPLITVVDELRSQIAFTRRWEAARQKLFTDPSIDNALRILLAVGVSLDHLQNVAADLDANWDRLESHPPQRQPIPAVDLGPLLRQTEDVLAHAEHCTDRADKLLTAFERIKSWHGRLAEAETGELGLVLELLHAVPRSGFGGGQKGNWSINVAVVRSSCKDLAEQAIALRNSFVEPALQTVTAAMAEVLLEAARERQRSGELEYHDLLIHARDLLVGEAKRAVHDALNDRYRCILLDEFQDTDPIQAELATRISAADVCGPDGWEQLQIPPGRLFTVGDPKQSIYRFRRADIATYLAAQQRFSADAASRIASLQTNFRSTGKLLQWINGTFGELIVPNGTIQPEYHALAPDPLRPEWHGEHGAAVSVIGRAGAQPGESGRVSADDMRRQEATDVATAIRIATGAAGMPAWQKQGKRSAGFVNTSVDLKDVCILIPTRTSLAALEDALDDAGIEYRAEASSLVYSTQEVTDLLLALQAISNTADEAALVLSLRSALFGCGDDELFEWKRAGGRWSIFSPAPDALKDSTVAQSLRYLAALCRDIEVLTPGEIMERLVTDRRMLEAAVDAPRYRDVWRRLRFVIDQALGWTEAAHGGLRDYLVWAGVQQEENSRVREAVVPETDVQAVRIMTIHASKGLEFPMVILAGTGSSPNNQKAAALWDQNSQLQVHFIRDIRSAGYNNAEALEAQFDDAERRRLLYVACTRAESHLIVSYYVNARNSLGQFLRDAADAGSAPDLDIPDELPERVKVPREVRSVEPFDDWQRSRETWQANSAIVSSTSVTAIAKGAGNRVDGELSSDEAVRFVSVGEDRVVPSFSEPGVEHGKHFGTALHRLLELSDLRETEDFDILAEGIAGASGLVDHAGLAERARSALRSTPVQRAADREHWLELPVVTSDAGVTLEGIIDLMYREDDGTLVIADFKTDIRVTQETLNAYWRQLSSYARMVERITGQTVSELVLIFCRAGEAEVRRQSPESKAVNVDS